MGGRLKWFVTIMPGILSRRFWQDQAYGTSEVAHNNGPEILARVAVLIALNSPRMEKVLGYLKDNEAKFIEQLCDYVRFPSVSAQTEKHGQDMKACCEW